MKPLTIEIKLAWWFTPYVIMLAAFCRITGLEPCPKKLGRVLNAATRGELMK
jgi:hypothetical protein